MGAQVVGWSASVVLLFTIGAQVLRQWRSATNEGVSSWLFVGQVTASTGFLIYSVMQSDAVFVVTNALLLLSALTGLVVMWRNRERS